MLLVAQFLSLAFSAFLPLINPLGSGIVFFGLVGPAPPEVYRRLALKIAITTVVFLLIIDVSGAAVLAFFSISLPVVQLAGGLVVVAIGWRLLNEESSGTREGMVAPGFDPRSLDEKVFYPFTFPITAGPGTLAVAITLSAHATQKTMFATVLAHTGILAAVILNCIAVYFCYAYAPRLTARISRQTIRGILNVIAFILLCIGAQIAWNGVQQLIQSVTKH